MPPNPVLIGAVVFVALNADGSRATVNPPGSAASDAPSEADAIVGGYRYLQPCEKYDIGPLNGFAPSLGLDPIKDNPEWYDGPEGTGRTICNTEGTSEWTRLAVVVLVAKDSADAASLGKENFEFVRTYRVGDIKEVPSGRTWDESIASASDGSSYEIVDVWLVHGNLCLGLELSVPNVSGAQLQQLLKIATESLDSLAAQLEG